MRILYDGFIYSAQAVGGVNRYFTNIINRLPEDIRPVLTAANPNKATLPTHKNLKLVAYKRFEPKRLSSIAEKIYFYSSLKFRQGINLQHPTYYSMLTPNKYNPVKSPVVRTVYDMINERYPAIYEPASYQATLKKNSVMTADFIICISENTKKDLIELYAIPEEKVQVIYIASDFHLEMTAGFEEIPPQPYFLFVGNREAAYKNFSGLLEAFARAFPVKSEVRLAVVGAKFSTAEEIYINKLNLCGKLINYGYASDNHLAKLYRHSLAFVYPSLYEGFGIPLLEAMACGGLVVAANRASIPEVVGNAAILFEPDANDQLPSILDQIAKGNIQREKYLTKGFEHVRLFSWDKTATQTVDLYRKLGR